MTNSNMPDTQHVYLAAHNISCSEKGSTVKTIGGKARNWLQRRNLSSSEAESYGAVSSMTIEFLYARLQAQRAVYKAEKQRVQQLMKKVMELEQKLSLEIQRRREMECRDVLVIPRDEPHSMEGRNASPCHDSSHLEDGPTCSSVECKKHHSCAANFENGLCCLERNGSCFCSMQCYSCHQSDPQGNLRCQSPLSNQSNTRSVQKIRANMSWRAGSTVQIGEQKVDIESEVLDAINCEQDLGSLNMIFSRNTREVEDTRLASSERLGFPQKLLQCADSLGKTTHFHHNTSCSAIENAESSSLVNFLQGLFVGVENRGHMQDYCSSSSEINTAGCNHGIALEGIMSRPNKLDLRADFAGLSMSSHSILKSEEFMKRQNKHKALLKREYEAEGRHGMAPHFAKSLLCSEQEVQ